MSPPNIVHEYPNWIDRRAIILSKELLVEAKFQVTHIDLCFYWLSITRLIDWLGITPPDYGSSNFLRTFIGIFPCSGGIGPLREDYCSWGTLQNRIIRLWLLRLQLNHRVHRTHLSG
jgi:hypothetical protein